MGGTCVSPVCPGVVGPVSLGVVVSVGEGGVGPGGIGGGGGVGVGWFSKILTAIHSASVAISSTRAKLAR